MKVSIVTFVLLVLIASPLAGQSDGTSALPPDAMLLVQSELDYLRASKRRITVSFQQATPEAALLQVERAARVSIAWSGTPPKGLKVTRSFDHATLKEVLTWYARRVTLTY